MDIALLTEILKSIGEGNSTKGLFLIVVFGVIWLEVKSLKKQFKTLNETVSNSFAKGEKRFETIESDIHKIREDVAGFKKLVTITNPGG